MNSLIMSPAALIGRGRRVMNFLCGFGRNRSSIGSYLKKASLCLGLCWCAGCQDPSPEHTHDGSGDHGHAHGTAEKTSVITVWTNGYEIFAEHPYVVAGREIPFVTHVTKIENGQPRREGPLRFELRHPEHASVEKVDPAPAREGIYVTPLTLPQAGTWQLTLHVSNGDREQPLPLPAIEVYPSESAVAEAPAPPTLEGITFLKEQQWKLGTSTKAVERRGLIRRVRASGHAKPVPGSLAAVTSPIEGYLLAPEQKSLPTLGQRVEAGEIMARIQPVAADATARLVDAQSEVDKARLALQQARSTFERVQKLAEVNAKSERELQEARFNMESAQAQYHAALTRSSHYQASGFELTTHTNLSEPNAKPEPATIVLRAPISGVVIDQLNVSLGEFIQIKQPLFKIHEPSVMWIEANIPEAAAARLGQAGDVRYELPGRPGHYYSIPGPNGGELLFTGMTVDPQTRTIPLTYQVPNNEGRLRIGQAVHLQIATDSAEQALAIPESAVMEEDQRPVAYVQMGGETFEKRPLELGIRDGNWVQVLEGLQAGERVVDQGAYAVRLAGTSSGIPAHGHAH